MFFFLDFPGNSKSVTHTDVSVLLQLQMSDTMNNLEELLRLSGGDGQIFIVDGALCMKSVQAMFGYDFRSSHNRDLHIYIKTI